MNNNYIEGTLLCTAANRAILESTGLLEAACARRTPVEARALRCEDEQLIFALGAVEGRLALGQLEYLPVGSRRRRSLPHQLVGRVLRFYIDRVELCEGRLVAVLDRRAVQCDFFYSVLVGLRSGDVLRAKVLPGTTVNTAFVDLGCGWVSAIPLRSFSVNRFSDMRQLVSPGMMLQVSVTDLLPDGTVELSHRALLGNWEQNVQLCAAYPGNTLLGTVTCQFPTGVFVALTPNLAGMLELNESTAALSPGETVAVLVKSTDDARGKVKLALVCATGEQLTPPQAYHYFADECPLQGSCVA